MLFLINITGTILLLPDFRGFFHTVCYRSISINSVLKETCMKVAVIVT